MENNKFLEKALLMSASREKSLRKDLDEIRGSLNYNLQKLTIPEEELDKALTKIVKDNLEESIIRNRLERRVVVDSTLIESDVDLLDQKITINYLLL